MTFADEPTDEPRRIEPDFAYLDDDEPDLTWMDRHLLDRTPGQWPSPIAGM